ncbi:PoNe immunity protein domain-containing protein [Listeria rocourtiae]|uniref:PoNe immunity protein domain-containing protein n=1 Tax=Listeria rocourtiae TaxID=647910 RepID=UPI0011EA59E9
MNGMKCMMIQVGMNHITILKKIYSGYWSYESGAIAKVLQLDDEVLKEVKYYPYDLVHYK